MIRPGRWILLLIIVAVPYATGLHNEFVYDDHGSIEENPFLNEPGNVQQVLTLQTLVDPTIPDGRRPLVILSYLLDHAVHGCSPFGYRLTNLLLHLLVVVLIFLFVHRLFPEQGSFIPFAAALIFGAHPVLTEAVQMPAFREDILLALFLLLFLLATTSRRAFWFSIPALALAFLSKESALVAPALLLWMWICFPATRAPRGRAVALFSISTALAVLFVTLWIRSGSLQAATADRAPMALQFPENLLTAPWLWVKILGVLAWPRPLIADYVIVPITQFSDWRFFAGAGALAACGFAALALFRRAPWLSFGLGWMLICFAPVSNLVPLYNPYAERYLYIVTVGFSLIVARLLSLLPEKKWRCVATRPEDPGPTSCLHSRALILAVICAAYTGLIVDRLIDWSNDLTLWSKTLLQEPRSARAHTWVGLGYKKMGKLDLAAKHFIQADQLNPQEISGIINIAILHGQAGRFDEAERLLREAIRRQPDKADAYWNLAVALKEQGRMNEAMMQVDKTLELDPRNVAARAVREEMMPGGKGTP